MRIRKGASSLKYVKPDKKNVFRNIFQNIRDSNNKFGDRRSERFGYIGRKRASGALKGHSVSKRLDVAPSFHYLRDWFRRNARIELCWWKAIIPG